ncbi:MAG: hypothetical protein WD294_04840 [Phycisphaeraceae bacterium]
MANSCQSAQLELCGEAMRPPAAAVSTGTFSMCCVTAQNAGRYVSLGGAALGRKLPGEPMAETVAAKAISTLRHRVIRIMRGRLDVECQREDVIENDGGYHLRDWIAVEVYDENGGRVSADTPAPARGSGAASGARLIACRRKDVVPDLQRHPTE